ncbi:pyridoxal-phosphate dependent enzyme [Methylovulum sp.]|uniref:1-aminocyclopropane-1-carboxylate deaminase/D-cysteine desulfhydrase n=1 Tax=Methylovulum sp. TaxID=1916980 RepID=UPI002622F74F|nr:pyridoxal-phosphate dependent enzyme [Methylovulum sp.]MDD5125867.1 pyridoxal-phosphate dependent enzyme [Methylovulum sp.]
MQQELINLEQSFQDSILTKINDPLLDQHQIELWLKRDDLLHPVISGNKWRKLKYLLKHALSLDSHTLISMGGVYSNHLHALAYVGQTLQLQTIGLIRGDQTHALTPTLQDASDWGMILKFVSRTDYRLLRKYQNWHDLPDLPPDAYWLTEGGAQTLALQGVAELASEISLPYDWLCAPCGTGTTLAGLITAVPGHSRVLGFAALKNAGFLYKDIAGLLPEPCHNWELNLDYHFGGFAQTSPELFCFIGQFQNQTGISLEPVYTGKMLYGLYDLIKKRTFKPGQRIIAIHTGGLQGNRGFPQCTDNHD